MATPTHFSSPKLSNWQSAVAKVATSPIVRDTLGMLAERLPIDFKDELLSAATAAANALEHAGGPALVQTADRCAAAALEIANARLRGDAAAEAAASAKFAAYGTCDRRWGECILEYVAHYATTKHGNVPYVRWPDIDAFVRPLPAKCRIAVIGDWGTGEVRAQKLLEEVGRRKPDILVHLGDVYFSCTNAEADRFMSNIRKVFPKDSRVAILTLCGNHDMYSGGAPYYGLLGQLSQDASFFCMRNDHWQVLAADTGYNDFDPDREGKVSTWVRDYDDGSRDYSELAWHHRRLTTAGTRRTILMTHHQPFSANKAIDPGSAMNARLHGQFEPFLGRIPLWIWGHEHNQVIYEEHAGIARGRCVGASAVPVASDEDPYHVDAAIKDAVPRVAGEPSKLTLDPTTGLYRLGFGLLDIDGAGCTETYVEFDPATGGTRSTFSDSF